MEETPIPAISHPKAMEWQQPKIINMLFDETHCIMSNADFQELQEYTKTTPNERHEGMMWKAYWDGKWSLVWYSRFLPDSENVRIKSRTILLLD